MFTDSVCLSSNYKLVYSWDHEYFYNKAIPTWIFNINEFIDTLSILCVDSTNVNQVYKYWFIRLIDLICLIDASIFTIVPETQYVYLNHNVTFECATNLTGYTLSFNYIFSGGSITPALKKSNLTDGGIKVSTTFTVTSTLNGTRIGCRADHSVNTPMLTSLANVYAQG